MIAPETLIALACMISNKGPIDTSSLESQLNSDEKGRVEAIISSGACLPDKLEKLLVETKTQFEKGDHRFFVAGSSPTVIC